MCFVTERKISMGISLRICEVLWRVSEKRYGSEEKLKKAWKREDASFDKPVIPNVQEQYFIFMEEGIMDAHEVL